MNSSKQFLYLCFSSKYKVKIDFLQWIFNEPVGIEGCHDDEQEPEAEQDSGGGVPANRIKQKLYPTKKICSTKYLFAYLYESNQSSHCWKSENFNLCPSP